MLNQSEPFLWIPGRGPGGAALKRFKDRFPKPASPMGEAWFISEEREMFTELMDEPERIPVQTLSAALREIASGTTAFGPLDEWRQWFRYLLPYAIARSFEDDSNAHLVEPIITAFIAQYPSGADDSPYANFRTDALNTLGLCLMDRACWPGGKIDVRMCLDKCPDGWSENSGPLCASIYFCLKYLEPEQVEAWLESALLIEAPEWRGQVMIWLVGAREAVLGSDTSAPFDFPPRDYPHVGWEDSFLLSRTGAFPSARRPSDLIPLANQKVALSTIARHFSDDVLMQWIDSLATDTLLGTELADLPIWFRDLYPAQA